MLSLPCLVVSMATKYMDQSAADDVGATMVENGKLTSRWFLKVPAGYLATAGLDGIGDFQYFCEHYLWILTAAISCLTVNNSAGSVRLICAMQSHLGDTSTLWS